MRAIRQRCLLQHSGLEVGIRTLQPLGDPSRDHADLVVQPLVEKQLATGHPRDELDRPVVVGRPEPARHNAQVVLERQP